MLDWDGIIYRRGEGCVWCCYINQGAGVWREGRQKCMPSMTSQHQLLGCLVRIEGTVMSGTLINQKGRGVSCAGPLY